LLGSPQVSRTPSILIECTSIQRFCTGLSKRRVNKTLFTLKFGNDFLLVQIYVDDIIFDGSSHVLVLSFKEMMEKEFQMSMMGELTFFLGIQVKQTKQGIFIHQAKYTKDLMKKFNMSELKPVSTPMSTTTALDTKARLNL
jgi:hypothetical protein